METLHSIMTVVSPDQWLASLDLNDVYFHVPIWSSHQNYFRFHWLGQTYQFQVLPFGMSLAPWVFTKVLAGHHCIYPEAGVPDLHQPG